MVTKQITPGKSIWLSVNGYRKSNQGGKIVVKDKNNQTHEFGTSNIRFYERYVDFNVPGNLLNPEVLPVNVKLYVGNTVVNEYTLTGTTPPSSGGGNVDLSEIEDRLTTLENTPVDFSPFVPVLEQAIGPRLLPEAGDPTQMLVKASSQTGDAVWVDPVTPIIAEIEAWTDAPLLFTSQFESGVPLWVTAALTGAGTVVTPNTRLVADSLGASKPSYTTALLTPNNAGANTDAQITTLALSSISSVTGKTVTKVVFRHSLQRGSATGTVSGTISALGTTRVTKSDPGANAATPWETTTILGNVGSVDLRVQRGSTTTPTQPTGWLVTGLEVYGTPTPYGLNKLVAYAGKRWRSTQANNPYTPGSGQGWIEV